MQVLLWSQGAFQILKVEANGPSHQRKTHLGNVAIILTEDFGQQPRMGIGGREREGVRKRGGQEAKLGQVFVQLPAKLQEGAKERAGQISKSHLCRVGIHRVWLNRPGLHKLSQGLKGTCGACRLSG